MTADEELLAAWRRGDRDAGAALFDRYFAAISRFFRTKVAESPDDLIQRTFLACVEARDRFEGRSSFRSYLFGVAYNVLREHARSRKRDAERFELAEVSAADLGPRPSSVLRARAEARALLEALRRLPLDHQVLLELYFWEPMTAAEIGESLGVPEGTVRTRLRRAKHLLEQELNTIAHTPGPLRTTATSLEDWARAVRP